MDTTWLSAAFDEIRLSGLNDDLRDVLLAFGRNVDDAPGPATLDPDDGGSCDVAKLQGRISNELRDEIDDDQASMFGRRFASVSTLLKGGGGGDDAAATSAATGRLLRLALHRRTVQILSTTDPVLSQRKALRVRALVDFIWSQSLVLGLKDDDARGGDRLPTLVELVRREGLDSASSTVYEQFSPGFRHATLEGVTSDFGPVHINVLRVDITNDDGDCDNNPRCPRMVCIDARKTCTDLPTLAEQTGAVAAISGGFFLYSEPDIEHPSARTDPVGLLVSDGKVAGPPVFRRAAILQGTNGRVDLDWVGMDGVRCIITLQSSSLWRQTTLELTVGVDNVRCWHRGDTEGVKLDGDECGLSVVGRKVVAGKVAGAISVPLAGYVLVFPRRLIPPGFDIASDDVTIDVKYDMLSPDAENAMAGGPMFFSEGDARDGSGCDAMDLPSEDFKGSAPPVTFSQDETHDHNLLPRMGVGIAECADGDGRQRRHLVCVAVDGRNLDRALGLTLKGTSDLLRSLGCTKAMNLDGGSSKRMVILDQKSKKHKVVCLSTTEIKANASGENNGADQAQSAVEPSRPVHSAILFMPAH